MTYRICVVGGGSAGWMSAATFATVFPQYKTILVESPNIKTVGVGESTLQHIRAWLDMLGIKDKDFLKEVDGTFKHAIKFTNFYEKNSGSFYYPFGATLGPDANSWWNKKNKIPFTPLSDYAESVNPLTLVSENNKFEKTLQHSYHFDATKFGLWLKRNMCRGKVKHVIGEVVEYMGNSIKLDNGREIEADLFVDCTGFKSQLLGGFLGEEFISYSDVLPNDSAVATHIKYRNPQKEMHPYTECTAIDNGWVWNIPLRDRIGTGYVYSSKYLSEEQAEKEFSSYLGNEELEFSHIKMRIGRHKRSWVNNVVAIGLSAGFIEPLESNGLFTVHENLLSLVKILRRGKPSQFSKDIFNSDIKLLFDEFADFVVAHYALSQRDDTSYWKDNFDRHYDIDGPSAGERYGLKHYSREFFRFDSYQFLDKGFHYLAAGMNFNPRSYVFYDEDEVRKLCEQKEQWKKSINDLPFMYDYLSRYYK